MTMSVSHGDDSPVRCDGSDDVEPGLPRSGLGLDVAARAPARSACSLRVAGLLAARRSACRRCGLSQPHQSVHQLPGCSFAPSSHCFGSSGSSLVADPVAALLLGRRVDHAGDVAGGAQHEARSCPAARSRAAVGALPRHDVVLARGVDVGRHVDRAEVDLLAADRQLARLDADCSRDRCCAGTSSTSARAGWCSRCSSTAGRTAAASRPSGSCRRRSSRPGRSGAGS